MLDKGTDPTFLLNMHVSIIGELFLSPCLTSSTRIVPAVLVTKSVEEIIPKVCELGEMYFDDLPSTSSLQSELHCWYLK